MDKKIAKKKLPVYKLEINMEDDSKVDVVSLVEDPATQKYWTAFSENGDEIIEKRFKFQIQDSEKQNIAGVFMVPDQPIYRKNQKTGEEFYVVIPKESIEIAQMKFTKNQYAKNISTNHGNNNAKAWVLENWIVNNPKCDKSLQFGSEVPEGSLYGIVHIDDSDLWNGFIKSGKLTGFSVQGLFVFGDQIGEKELMVSAKMSKQTPEKDDKMDEIFDILAEKILNSFK